jgi:hypothetical protein
MNFELDSFPLLMHNYHMFNYEQIQYINRLQRLGYALSTIAKYAKVNIRDVRAHFLARGIKINPYKQYRRLRGLPFKPLTNDRIEKIKIALSAGHSLREVSQAFHTPYTKVRRIKLALLKEDPNHVANSSVNP